MGVRWRGCIAICIGLAPTLAAFGQDAVPPAVQKLVDDLASVDFAVRDEAQKKLVELGQAARPALEKALQSSDAESRLRAEEILRDLRSTDLWVAATVTLAKSNVPASEVFKEIERQSGNPFDWKASKGLEGKTLSVDWKGKPYWQALDEACRATGLQQRIEDGKDFSGVVLTPAERGPLATAYEGPVRLRVTYTSRQAFGFRGRRDWGERGGETLDLNYELHWEPRITMCRYLTRLKVLEALTDANEALTFRNFGPAPSPMHVTLKQHEVNYRTSLRQFRAAGTSKLSRLRVETTLTAAGDFAKVEVPMKPGASGRESGYLLEFLSAKPADKRSHELAFLWTRPTPLDVNINAMDLADESMSLHSAGNKELPFAVRQQIGDRAAVRYVLLTPADITGGKVSFRIARLKSAKRFEFKFADVPITTLE